MAQMDTTMSTAPDLSITEERKHQRLQTLVGELLVTNQQLRFRVEQLEQEKGLAERALASATAVAGLLLP